MSFYKNINSNVELREGATFNKKFFQDIRFYTNTTYRFIQFNNKAIRFRFKEKNKTCIGSPCTGCIFDATEYKKGLNQYYCPNCYSDEIDGIFVEI